MNYSTIIHDSKALKTVTPGQVEHYLRKHRWHITAVHPNDKVEIWGAPHGDYQELFLLRKTDYADYPQRIQDILRVMAEFQGHKDQLRVFCEITETPMVTVSVCGGVAEIEGTIVPMTYAIIDHDNEDGGGEPFIGYGTTEGVASEHPDSP